MCVYKWCTDISEGPNQQSLSLDSIILRVQWVWIEGFNLSPFLVIYFKGERAFLLPRWEYRAAGICISLAAVAFTSKYGLNSGSSLAQRALHCDRAPQNSLSPEAEQATPAAAWGQRQPGEFPTAFSYKSCRMKFDGKSIKVPSALPSWTPLKHQPPVSVPSAAGGDRYSASRQLIGNVRFLLQLQGF